MFHNNVDEKHNLRKLCSGKYSVFNRLFVIVIIIGVLHFGKKKIGGGGSTLAQCALVDIKIEFSQELP